MSNQSENCPIDKYYESWNTGDLAKMEESLAPNVKFRGPMEKHDSAKSFIASVYAMTANSAFKNVKLVPRTRIMQGDNVAAFYELQTSQGSFPVAELFRVKDGKIQEINCYFDPAPFKPAH